MTFMAIVIVTALGTPPFQLDDQINPVGYNDLGQCWFRVANMVREVSNRIPVTNAVGVCATNPNTTPKPTNVPELGA
jgi:hypothetical protein